MSLRQVLFILFSLFIVINLVFLDLFVFKLSSQVSNSSRVASSEKVINDQECGKSCNEAIEQAVKKYITPAKSTSSSLTANTSTSGSVKEYFIPLGSGVTSTTDWANVSGLESYIDTALYQNIKVAYFEISLRIPTGNQTVYARLYNQTDKHAVWFSDVSFDGGTPKLLVSPTIKLDTGNKLYIVQIKTQLGYQVFIDQARVHITTR